VAAPTSGAAIAWTVRRALARYSIQRPPRSGPDLLERVREHPQEQRFERLARPEQADVRGRGRRQQTAKRVERLRADDRPVHGVGVLGSLGVLRAEMRFNRGNPARVRLEGGIERPHELIAQR
jgi:hypothetical protein